MFVMVVSSTGVTVVTTVEVVVVVSRVLRPRLVAAVAFPSRSELRPIGRVGCPRFT